MKLTPSEILLIKKTMCAQATPEELELFVSACEKTNLDPFSVPSLICPVFRFSKKYGRDVMSVQIQVDGFRLHAQRSGCYAGSDSPLYDEGLTLSQCIQAGREQPTTCSITVYRIVQQQRCAFTADISWKDIYPGDRNGAMWNAKPYHMMAKATECLALRKAFQSESISSSEEDLNAWTVFCARLRKASSDSEILEMESSGIDEFPQKISLVKKEVAAARELLAAKSPGHPMTEDRQHLLDEAMACIQAIGWEPKQAQEFMLSKWKKTSRKAMSDQELGDFIKAVNAKLEAEKEDGGDAEKEPTA
jgi:phage recombination protein Bet